MIRAIENDKDKLQVPEFDSTFLRPPRVAIVIDPSAGLVRREIVDANSHAFRPKVGASLLAEAVASTGIEASRGLECR
jgi:hypothetical protein